MEQKPPSHIKKHSKIMFTPAEDQELLNLVEIYGTSDWETVALSMKGRNKRQVRDRYMYYLNPRLNKSKWTEEEDRLLEQKYSEIGNKWRKIAKFFKNRTDIDMKNRWKIIQRRNKIGEKADYSSPEPPKDFEQILDSKLGPESFTFDENSIFSIGLQDVSINALFDNVGF